MEAKLHMMDIAIFKAMGVEITPTGYHCIYCNKDFKTNTAIHRHLSTQRHEKKMFEAHKQLKC
jgi:hypothetical protein